MELIRTEQHHIRKKHKLYNYCDDLSLKSKNLYNYANYIVRQEFINNGKWIRYKELNQLLKTHETYRALMAQMSQQILKLIDKNWKSYFKAIKDWNKNKNKYLGMPKLPNYKRKDGRSIVIFTNQNCKIVDGVLKFPRIMDQVTIKTKIHEGLQQVRIVPIDGHYVIEVVYKKVIKLQEKESERIMGIDLGINNFATLVTNCKTIPIVINGKPIKSINHYYNKQLAKYRSSLKTKNNKDWSNRLQKLSTKRNNKINDYIHKASSYIIKYCLNENIDTIVIGINKTWKQESVMASKTNQQFVQIPYASFIEKLKYKSEENNIKLIETEESYTSGTSFIDGELPIREYYCKSRRIKRGLFKSDTGELINADVNGAYQIIKKLFPNIFLINKQEMLLHPKVITLDSNTK